MGRGVSWGAAIGAGGGVVALATTALFSGVGAASLVIVVPVVGPVFAVVGACYGAIAGAVVGAAVAPIATRPWASAATRLIAATVGVCVVAAISTFVFDPSFEPGANETAEHVRDDVTVFYAVPCALALLAGGLLAPRLLLRHDAVEHRRSHAWLDLG